MSPAQFRLCPTVTVFSFGPKFEFRGMLILETIIEQNARGSWGFWAVDPRWADAKDSLAAIEIMEQSLVDGSQFDCEISASKYMSIDDGHRMEAFIVLDGADWRSLSALVNVGNGTTQMLG